MDRESFKKFLSVVRAEYDKRILCYSSQMNLIDEMVENNKNLNETIHSKIMARLLHSQDKASRFIFLERLLQLIKTNILASRKDGKEKANIEWSKIRVKNPQFTLEPYCQEEDRNGRIDILIEDNDYAIIFENKINDAVIQESQIARYISKVKERGFAPENIYVILLKGRENAKLDIGNMWEFRGINYEEEFRYRYEELSFERDILKLISDFSTEKEDILLNSSLLLYADYLKRRFGLVNNIEYSIVNDILQKKDDSDEKTFLSYLCDYYISLEKYHSMKRDGASINELKSQIGDKRVCINHALSALFDNFYPNATVSFHGTRDVHLGCKVLINSHNYLSYIGSNGQGLFCSVLKLDEVDFDNKFKEELIKLGLRAYNNTGYVFDRCDRDYMFLPKLELFLKVMDKCVELQSKTE